MNATKKTRVLVVDDSALVRNMLTRGLSMDPHIEVVGSAGDPFQARDAIVKLRPDVLTLDVEMPRMDGVQFLRKLMPQFPLPVIMVSSLTQRGSQITLDALGAGAVDFVLKPDLDLAKGLEGMMIEIRSKVRMASRVDVRHWKGRAPAAGGNGTAAAQNTVRALPRTTDKVIAIGASTGGTEAIREVITALPAHSPGVVIVQHMPAGFTKMFAERLNAQSAMEVKEAESGDRVITGRVLVAPGDQHIQLVRSGGEYRVVCRFGQRVCGHRPSVEVLFRSVAKYAGPNAIGVMMTGMGHDGADGMVKMRESKSRTMAQDERTSVVFGMPKEAYQRGGAEQLVPLQNIPDVIKTYLEEMG
ncbi:MAG TPA: chemotaxis response regulator protein-glutamate methylesterase [Calditrichia bacterium]|nr:chemotaxis response regulator protein-glutamate methylesterase [Calditrichota bacterium]HQV31880.1 chemotaxis response regulator protein-glutamate methylesterase [Calditrichia bacterium]